jgi:hypothetical protein
VSLNLFPLPSVGHAVEIATHNPIPLHLSTSFLRQPIVDGPSTDCRKKFLRDKADERMRANESEKTVFSPPPLFHLLLATGEAGRDTSVPIRGVLMQRNAGPLRLLTMEEADITLGRRPHKLAYRTTIRFNKGTLESGAAPTLEAIRALLQELVYSQWRFKRCVVLT